MTDVSVVGGTYIERCADPAWDEILGSGLRGALVLRQLGATVTYATLSDAIHSQSIAQAAREAGIEPRIEASAHLISFTYRHALARPFIDPPLHRIQQAESLRVEASRVLRYGMLEGEAVVRAKIAVYDPQNSERPARFAANVWAYRRSAVKPPAAAAGSLRASVNSNAEGQARLVSRKQLSHRPAPIAQAPLEYSLKSYKSPLRQSHPGEPTNPLPRDLEPWAPLWWETHRAR
jgi:hypothetical protein